jgi:glycosyltransferase involved in cell wall biosynthesis
MESRKSLLFVSACTPDPRGTGWEQRAYATVLAYSRLMAVDLWFMPTADNPDLARIAALGALCRSITSFYPSLVNDDRSGLKARLVGRLTSADVLHVFRFQDFVQNVAHPCIVWDIDELPGPLRHAAPAAAVAAVPAGQLERLRVDFARCIDKCRLVIGCSPLERPAGCSRFAVVPNVVRRPAPAAAAPTADDRRLLFVGNLNYPPNADGLAFFADQVLPILHRMEPDVRLDAVGRSPTSDASRAMVKRLQQDDRLRFAFDVADCAPSYMRSSLSIAPIRFGGGTRVKIIESFAHRCPVVSTTKGCEGLKVENGRQLLIADHPADFAHACARLLREPSLREQISGAAFETFDREYTQPVADASIASAVGSLLQP